MGKRYAITLSDPDRQRLVAVVHNPAVGAQAQSRALILLAADEGASDQQIASRLLISVATVHRTRKRYVLDGLEGAIGLRLPAGSDTPTSPPEAVEWLTRLVASSHEISGLVGVAVVDLVQEACLPGWGDDGFLAVEALGNIELVRAKLRTITDLRLADELEDILITLSTQYHLIRLVEADRRYFLYVALDRRTGNLAMARHQLQAIEHSLAG